MHSYNVRIHNRGPEELQQEDGKDVAVFNLEPGGFSNVLQADGTFLELQQVEKVSVPVLSGLDMWAELDKAATAFPWGQLTLLRVPNGRVGLLVWEAKKNRPKSVPTSS